MEINTQEIAALVRKIMEGISAGTEEKAGIPIGVSNRHIHLSKEDVATLFGEGYELTKIKHLKQPGQYACRECLTIVGPSMRPIEGVRVLGPVRSRTQVEISLTDSYQLKVKPPVRESGDLDGAAPITIIGPCGIVRVKDGCIIANRHIHMGVEDAERFGVRDGDYVTVDAVGTKHTRWYGVQVRAGKQFTLEMHVDTDDANGAGIGNGTMVTIVKE